MSKPKPITSIAYRISEAVATELRDCAKAAGLSEHGYAREALIEKLQRAQAERGGWLELFEEVRRLRSELATATQAILTVSSQPVTAQDAEEWVRKNLNR